MPRKKAAHEPQTSTAEVHLLPVYTNDSRPPAHPDIMGALVFNRTTGRVECCTGDKWTALIAQLAV